jgi:hypothetical protein
MNTLKQSIYMFSLTFNVIMFIILIDYIVAYIKHLDVTNMVGLQVDIINFLFVLVVFGINFTHNIIISQNE